MTATNTFKVWTEIKKAGRYGIRREAIVEATGMSLQEVCNAVDRLRKKHLLLSSPDPDRPANRIYQARPNASYENNNRGGSQKGRIYKERKETKPRKQDKEPPDSRPPAPICHLAEVWGWWTDPKYDDAIKEMTRGAWWAQVDIL